MSVLAERIELMLKGPWLAAILLFVCVVIALVIWLMTRRR